LALLLASFGSNLLSEREKEDDDNKIGEAIDRIQRCFRLIFRFIYHLFRRNKRQKLKIIESNTNETIYLNQVCLKFVLKFSFSYTYLFSVFGWYK
jgi:hypothetical protein